MTGVTLALQPWQVGELRRYLDGPLAEETRPDNLVRRGMLERVGPGTYGLTTLGRAALREAETLELRYHVPRSQVWPGSRGGQSGRTHLHVRADFESGRLRRRASYSLCGRDGWYERPPDDDRERTGLCPRCVEIAERHGLDLPSGDRE